MMHNNPAAETVLKLASSFQPACVLAAAADLEIFDTIAGRSMTAAMVATQIGTDLRATTVLLDALAALKLLTKNGEQYSVPNNIADVLTDAGAHSVLPMVLHQANCLRRWVQLPQVVKTGQRAERRPSIRGETADTASFIGAMHTIAGPVADTLVARLAPFSFKHLLDIGGGSGTWTMAFLRLAPNATATIFDLPDVIPLARRRLAEAGFADRVRLVPGDFYADALPAGTDYAWLSAIAHQNSREQNRTLFGKIHDALAPGGTLAIRDIVMDEDHINPPGGAMFAVNMLTGTDRGGTYSLAEYADDLQRSGFAQIELAHRDPWMDCLIRAARQ